jgi:hypothetical protein
MFEEVPGNITLTLEQWKISTKCDFLLRPPLILMVDYRRRFIDMMMLEITIYGALHYSIRPRFL